MDKDILARTAHAVRVERSQEEDSQEHRRSCFYCLEGWVFLGSIGHDGEEIVESIRCRRCKGTGETNH